MERARCINHKNGTCSETSGPNRKQWSWQPALLCAILAAVTFAVFGQTLTYDFINYDDGEYVYANPMVSEGLTSKGISWAFNGAHASNWHPLTWLSHELDCQIYGLRPGGHHLTNVLLHTAAVISLFLVLLQMTDALWRSAFAAAVFAIHPLRAESVAWIAERKDVLSGLFFMLTVGAYIRYARRPDLLPRYGLVVVLFTMGLMCKPMLVTLPLVLLLLDYWPLRRNESTRRLLLEKLPLLALAAVSAVITIYSQRGAMQSTGSFSLPYRLETALAACLVYLKQMFWPRGLALFYPYPATGLPAGEISLAAILLTGITALAWWQRKARPWMLMGWLWYLVMLLPVLGIIQVGGQAHADRYTYLPQIGVGIALTWFAAEWGARFQRAKPILGCLVLAALAICCAHQVAYWKNSNIVWAHTLACTAGNEVAHNGAGQADLQNGDTNAAISQFQQALQINPTFSPAHENLGNVLVELGRFNEAISQYQSFLQIEPDNPDVHEDLGIALFRRGKTDEAISQFQEALRIKPNDSINHNLSLAYLKSGQAEEAAGRYDVAITNFETALRINPRYSEAHDGFGVILMLKGKAGEAIAQFRQALEIAPTEPKFQNDLAWLLVTSPDAALRNGPEALELARQANQKTGEKNPIYLHTLAAALADNGRFDEAMRFVRQAIALADAAGNRELSAHFRVEFQRYQAGLPLHQ